ncbi:CotO family spore coat protein [Heyndrickxia oleronia]|uniref:CotO family spore coat protein n=1 Tax=Heyndrickxia oleronia TaxID=38875 RepID=A0AAW6SRM0_9BACI|nr:CotO family spore coat protein [Heyndrickxia oleronia]MDH5160923.1 CotO family spore coat protein [Heyndrickxia oleronia]
MSIRKKHFEERKPLLYIIQPNSQSIPVDMQKTYISKVSNDKHVEEINDNNENEPIEDTVQLQKEVEIETHSDEQIINESPSFTISETDTETIREETVPELVQEQEEDLQGEVSNHLLFENGLRRKSFRSMEIGEKLYFLVNKPRYLPNLTVEIRTESVSYTGVVLSFNNGIVQLDQLLMGERPIEINMNDIVDIKIATN